MKRILLLMSSVMLTWMGAFAEDTTDKLYATDVRFDEIEELSYIDICLQGSQNYIAYGTDVLLPPGLLSLANDNTPNVVMIDWDYTYNDDIIYPYSKSGRKYTYYHTVMSAFPYNDRHHVRVGCLNLAEETFTAESGDLFRIYVESDYTDGAWPLGAIKCYDVELTVDKDHYYEAPVTETIVPVHTGETTLPLKVSQAAKWSTCILPFAASIPEGVKAYTCSHSDEEYIYLEKAESFAAYTPYILYAENGFDGNINGTVEATIPDNAKTGVVANGYLNGAIVPQTATEGYVLQNHDGNVKFYAIADNDSFAIPAGKCWMNIPASESRALTFRTDNVTDGINNITLPTSSLPYDLNGRQQTVKKGVLIKNGQKTLSL